MISLLPGISLLTPHLSALEAPLGKWMDLAVQPLQTHSFNGQKQVGLLQLSEKLEYQNQGFFICTVFKTDIPN